MPRTSNRRWKGCPLCMMHKHAGHGDPERRTFAESRVMGRARRWTRRTIPPDQENR